MPSSFVGRDGSKGLRSQALQEREGLSNRYAASTQSGQPKGQTRDANRT